MTPLSGTVNAPAPTATASVAVTGTRTPRSAGIDVLRGIAVGLVLLRHAWPEVFGGAGIAGVVLFFALSGYLITGVLLSDLRRTGAVDYRRFYTNRALRLLPALILFVCAYVVINLAVKPREDWPLVAAAAAAGLLYLADLPLPFPMGGGISQLWTLAVEEQFYLLWPVVLAVGWRRRELGRAMLGAMVVAVLACLATLAVVGDAVDAYTLPTPWIAALVIGSAARVRRDAVVRALRGRRGDLAALASVLLVAACAVAGELKLYPLTYVLLVPALAVAGTVLTLRLERWQSPGTGLPEALRRLGLISYACYLWNPLVILCLGGVLTGWLSWLVPVLSIPVTVLAGVTSWRLVERPALRLKDRLVEAHVRAEPSAVPLDVATR